MIIEEKQLIIDKLEQARELVAEEDEFSLWSYYVNKLKLVESSWLPTAGTEGIHFFYNPEFIKILSLKQCVFLWIHEVFHIVGRHLFRYPKDIFDLSEEERVKEFSKWNMAGDYAINQVLKPFCEKVDSKMEWIGSDVLPPDGALYDLRFEDMAMETIYPLLENKCQKTIDIHFIVGVGESPKGAYKFPGGGWVIASDGEGNIIKIPEKSSGKGFSQQLPSGFPKSSKELESLVKGLIEKAEQDRGTGKGVVQRVIELPPDPNESSNFWRKELDRFIISKARADYSYKRLHRGWFARSGVIVPTLRSERLEGVISIDISGSIDQNLYRVFANEVEAIRGQLPEHVFTIIWADDGIDKVVSILPGDQIDWTCKGGGGTDFRPVFSYLNQENIENLPPPPDIIDFLLFFTDADGYYPDKVPSYPVMWVVSGSGYKKIPKNFGEVLILPKVD